MTPEEIVVQLEHCLNTKGDPGTRPNFYAAEKLVETEIAEAEARGRMSVLEEAESKLMKFYEERLYRANETQDEEDEASAACAFAAIQIIRALQESRG